mmetsp:Transcript_28834/g.93133  ORF Transcript_28834/g.93133 Transcript_28834/m.93133 type:complete len:255 (-) Transcript_28834:658-1422(-)
MPILRLTFTTDMSAFFSPGGVTYMSGPPVSLPSSFTGRTLSFSFQPPTSLSCSMPSLRIFSTATSTAASASVGLRSSTSLGADLALALATALPAFLSALLATAFSFFCAALAALASSFLASLVAVLTARSASIFSSSAAISVLYRSRSAAALASYGARSSSLSAAKLSSIMRTSAGGSASGLASATAERCSRLYSWIAVFAESTADAGRDSTLGSLAAFGRFFASGSAVPPTSRGLFSPFASFSSIPAASHSLA